MFPLKKLNKNEEAILANARREWVAFRERTEKLIGARLKKEAT